MSQSADGSNPAVMQQRPQRFATAGAVVACAAVVLVGCGGSKTTAVAPSDELSQGHGAAVPTASGSSWQRVHVWTSHSLSLTAARRLQGGTSYRLVSSAKNPKTWMHVLLICGSRAPDAKSYRVRPRRETLTFRSSGCNLSVLMLGHMTLSESGMFMRIELDRR